MAFEDSEVLKPTRIGVVSKRGEFKVATHPRSGLSECGSLMDMADCRRSIALALKRCRSPARTAPEHASSWRDLGIFDDGLTMSQHARDKTLALSPTKPQRCSACQTNVDMMRGFECTLCSHSREPLQHVRGKPGVRSVAKNHLEVCRTHPALSATLVRLVPIVSKSTVLTCELQIPQTCAKAEVHNSSPKLNRPAGARTLLHTGVRGRSAFPGSRVPPGALQSVTLPLDATNRAPRA